MVSYNIDMILYKDCRHEVLNELGHEQVYGDISKWLDQHLQTVQCANVQAAQA